MRDSGSSQVLSTIIVFYLLAFLASVIWSFAAVPEVLAVFRWPYIWTSAFVRFVDYAIPITVSAVAVGFSLFVRRRAGLRLPFHRLVSSKLTLMVAFAVLYTVVLLGFYPRSRAQLGALQALSREGRDLLAAAKAARSRKDEEAALKAYDRYLTIDRGNREVLAQRDDLQAVLRRSRSQGEEKPAPTAEQPAGAKKASELLQMARGFFDREDYFSAYYYAGLASRLDPRSKEAPRLEAKAWDRIQGARFSKEEMEKRRLFEAKKRGHEMFQREDYVAAYYHFLELAELHPKDADVTVYLARSREQVRTISYFLDEAEDTDPLPGERDLLFVNPREEGLQEIVSIGKITAGPAGTFFKDIELLRFGERGLEAHFRAPYGKLAESEASGAMKILLRGIDRSDKREALPQYLAGSQRRQELRNLLSLSVDREVLGVLRERPELSGLGIAVLWKARDRVSRYGHGEYVLSMELLMRLLLPFAFLNLCLLAAALGWSYRFASLDRPPVPAYLLIPVFPLAAAPLAALYLKAHRILTGFALLKWGFWTALIGLAALQGAVLALMLILLSGQRTD